MSTESERRRFPMTIVLALGLSGFVAWAWFAEIDSTVRATGQVIPSGRTQIIQSADGGVVSQIKVHEGQSVEPGEVLAVLESNRAEAGYQESKARSAALRAALARARAEATGAPLEFSGDLDAYPDFLAAQRALYSQRKSALEETLDTLQKALEMAREELEINRRLSRSGDVGRLELLQAQRTVIELEGKVASAQNEALQNARLEVTKFEEELASSDFTINERQDVLRHTNLVSPVAGVVKYLRINTVGGVLRPGDELMQIAPSDGGVILEVKVSPADVGALRLGLPANVRLDAFDYSIYGALQGKVTLISPDTLSDTTASGQSMPFYRVHVRLNEDQSQNPRHSEIRVIPGLTATVDVITGHRSVMTYLLKPVVRGFSGALTER